MKADADYWKGFWAGRAIAVRLAALGKEVSDWYLYNGVRLPRLPVVEGLPYAYTSGWFEPSSTSGTLCYLWLTSEPLCNKTGGVISVPVGSYYTMYKCIKDTDYWELYVPKKQQTAEYSSVAQTAGKWANHNILNVSFGYVYLAASDPIPTT